MSHTLPRLPSIDRNSPRPLFGLSLSYPTPGIIERIGAAWDWFWIDAQHGELDFPSTVELVRAADFIGVPGLVRVPTSDPTWVSKILDAGAAGVIIPMVESVAEAKAMVLAAKFPPIGNRSFGGLRVATRNGSDYYKTANRDTVLILQLESNEAVALADEFAAMEGVDGLFIGPDDLVIRNGHEITVPKDMALIGKQTEIVARACRRHRKLNVGLAGNDTGLAMAKHFGHDLVVGGGEFFLLQAASEARIEKMYEYFNLAAPKKSGAKPAAPAAQPASRKKKK